MATKITAGREVLTPDQMAIRLLLAGDQKGLTRLAEAVEAAHDPACPECGNHEGIMDNGARGADLSYCCPKCGEHFDAVTEIEFEV